MTMGCSKYAKNQATKKGSSIGDKYLNNNMIEMTIKETMNNRTVLSSVKGFEKKCPILKLIRI